jgi:hypothetical protein
MMKFLKSNIILVLLIAFFSFIIVLGLMKSMNIYEGMATDVPATPGPAAAIPGDSSASAPACQAAPDAPTSSKITTKSKNG